jgi:hypothetical protein
VDFFKQIGQMNVVLVNGKDLFLICCESIAVLEEYDVTRDTV